LEICDVDGKAFLRVLGLWFGGENGPERNLREVQELVSVADRFQVSEVVAVLEETMIEQLRVDECGEVLTWSTEVGLERLEEAARALAASRFEEVASTAGFATIDEETLGLLLDDDELRARNEEAVWEAVLAWIKAEDGTLRGCGLLSKIRFPLMDEAFLLGLSATAVDGMLSAEQAGCVRGLAAEALRAKASRSGDTPFAPTLLGRRALAHRAGTGVKWADYRCGGERRLRGHASNVLALAECQGRVCSASESGSIRVWSRETLAHERTLHHDAGGREEDGFYDPVFALVGWGGRLVSGHDDGHLRVWDVLSGACEQVLEGHAGGVLALAACGPRLVSGSADESLRVWAAPPGGGGPWACERTLLGSGGDVVALAAWGAKAISGAKGSLIRVWDAGTGACDATLAGHRGAVWGLAVHGGRLLSASFDGTVRAWAAGTWAPLRTVEAYPRGADLYPRCLAASGGQLVCGACSCSGDARCEVRVWGLEALEPQLALPQPPGDEVDALLALEGEVWAAVGRALVVWGRK
jgi:hypothetical protein